MFYARLLWCHLSLRSPSSNAGLDNTESYLCDRLSLQHLVNTVAINDENLTDSDIVMSDALPASTDAPPRHPLSFIIFPKAPTHPP